MDSVPLEMNIAQLLCAFST